MLLLDSCGWLLTNSEYLIQNNSIGPPVEKHCLLVDLQKGSLLYSLKKVQLGYRNGEKTSSKKPKVENPQC